MKPKTITAKIVVPEWVKHLATEGSGSVWGYSRKPVATDYLWKSKSGRFGYLFTTTPPRNWRKTLRRVK